MRSINELADVVRETSFSIHKYHRHGHLEKIYESALFHRLSRQGFAIERQAALSVLDEDGTLLGEFFADLVVEQRLMIELKAVRRFADEHIAQVLGYLRSSRFEHALLINFGAPTLEIRKFALSDR